MVLNEREFLMKGKMNTICNDCPVSIMRPDYVFCWDFFSHFIYSLCPSEAIWCHKTRSTLVQVIARSLMAPSHYLNQFWLLVKWIRWNKLEWSSNHNTNGKYSFMKMRFKLLSCSNKTGIRWMRITDDIKPWSLSCLLHHQGKNT